MTQEPSALISMQASFWSFVDMILGPQGRAEIEEALKHVPQRPRAVPYLGSGADPAHFCAAVAIAAKKRGRSFARRAGYYAGSQIARRFVESTPHPNEEAHRMMKGVAASFPQLQFIGSPAPAPAFTLEVRSPQALGTAFADYATGFLRGAAARIHEGTPSLVEVVYAKDELSYKARIEWERAGDEPPTGGRRTRRR